MTTCLILAAGDAERHNGGNKPLLKVNGETLLARTWRRFSPYVGKTWLVTHRSDLASPSWDGDAGNFMPPKRRWITETLLSSMPLWSNDDATTILLGDVFYGNETIGRILGTKQKISAFGNGCNIHAVRWFVDDNSYVAKRLQMEVAHAEKHPNKHGSGKLWHWINADPEVKVFGLTDETTDFDSPLEHKRFVEKYGNRSTHRTG